ncbi:MAG: hypothetical protein JSR39_09460 [Verrucomicrobia bacterium]|nr:hypothetical protein [Verrucomicrobiota bacterium]
MARGSYTATYKQPQNHQFFWTKQFCNSLSLLTIICLSQSLFLSAEEQEPLPALKRGFFFFADPVYWQAHEDGLAYVTESNSSTTLAPHSKAENLHFDWDFGFEVGFGYRIPHDLWSFSLELKHIHTNAHGHKTAGEGKALFPLWKLPDAQDPSFAHEAKAHWRLHLGLLDLIMKKDWRPSKTCIIAPVLGLRSAWIRQKYNLFYLGGSLLPDREEQFSMKNKFWGIGPSIGMRSSWEFAHRWSVFGDIMASILYGEFYLHQAEWALPSKSKILGIHEIFRSSVTTSDLTLGVRWETEWKGTLKKLSLELAWDQIFLYAQNQFIRFTDPSALGIFASNQGDLSLQGYHIGARFDF